MRACVCVCVMFIEPNFTSADVLISRNRDIRCFVCWLWWIAVVLLGVIKVRGIGVGVKSFGGLLVPVRDVAGKNTIKYGTRKSPHGKKKNKQKTNKKQ